MEPVLLGVCDGDLDPGRYRCSYQTNKVGGVADWLPGISGTTPRCGLCGVRSGLVVQIYCPLDATDRHRNLHLFACSAPTCSGRPGSWTALRSQSPDTPETRRGPQPDRRRPPPDTRWCDGAEDWGEEEEEEGDGGRERKEEGANGEEDEEGAADEGSGVLEVGGRLQDLSLEEQQQPVFCPLFISVVEEEELSGEEVGLDHARQLLREYERREGAVGEGGELAGGGHGAEKYEKTGARHGDAVFCKFLKRTSLCPQQILRYQRGGSPLLVSPLTPSMAEAAGGCCGSCSGPRMFELQLMPGLVSLLRRTDGNPDAELEFGTLLVFTCSNSCWPAGQHQPLEETCWLQNDPDQQLFTQQTTP